MVFVIVFMISMVEAMELTTNVPHAKKNQQDVYMELFCFFKNKYGQNDLPAIAHAMHAYALEYPGLYTYLAQCGFVTRMIETYSDESFHIPFAIYLSTKGAYQWYAAQLKKDPERRKHMVHFSMRVLGVSETLQQQLFPFKVVHFLSKVNSDEPKAIYTTALNLGKPTIIQEVALLFIVNGIRTYSLPQQMSLLEVRECWEKLCVSIQLFQEWQTKTDEVTCLIKIAKASNNVQALHNLFTNPNYTADIVKMEYVSANGIKIFIQEEYPNAKKIMNDPWYTKLFIDTCASVSKPCFALWLKGAGAKEWCKKYLKHHSYIQKEWTYFLLTLSESKKNYEKIKEALDYIQEINNESYHLMLEILTIISMLHQDTALIALLCSRTLPDKFIGWIESDRGNEIFEARMDNIFSNPNSGISQSACSLIKEYHDRTSKNEQLH